MEATEELVGSTTSNSTVAKGKRTKRHRPLSNSSSSSASGDDHVSFNSSTTTTYDSTEEEEDMANCLILLAQGGDAPNKQASNTLPSPITKINGFYVYECKTCNRTFPSFQALGGHRASHKKPKLDDKKPQPQPQPPLPTPAPLPPPQSPSRPPVTQVGNFDFEEAGGAQVKTTPPVQMMAFQSNKAKIHECSICGSEFTSGQALGGHMRRHRAATNTGATAAPTLEVKPRNVLGLDLNLPAPEDDLRDSKFQFTPTQKPLVLSAPALVDCHYWIREKQRGIFFFSFWFNDECELWNRAFILIENY